jgi:hypothetical protein
VNASLFQIQSASRSPWGGTSELYLNAALAMVEAAAPKDEIEAALAVQMVCTHTAAMAVLAIELRLWARVLKRLALQFYRFHALTLGEYADALAAGVRRPHFQRSKVFPLPRLLCPETP